MVHLSLNKTTSITDEGLKHLSSGCHILTYLDLQSCNKITEQGLKHLAHEHGTLIIVNNIRVSSIIYVENIFLGPHK